MIADFNEIKKNRRKKTTTKKKKIRFNKSKKHINYLKKKWCLYFDRCFDYFPCSFVGMSFHNADYFF